MHATGTDHGVAIRVRTAGVDDVGTVVAMRLALVREYGEHALYGRLHPKAEERAPPLCEEQIASSRDAFFLAESEGNVVGLLRCTESHASPLLLPERFAYVSSAYVVPAWRRRGVLRALLARAERWCAVRGLTEMRLHNVPGGIAAAAWTALAFEPVEEVRIRHLRTP
ncbi:MAG TPA: GNAT family N-acetyltransferase [Gemmatimonadaceae bacterium]